MTPRFSRTRYRNYWWLLAIAMWIVLRLAYDHWHAPPSVAIAEGVYRVARVVDGDTLQLESGVRVRLQGIDTPETVRPDYPVEPWGKEATQFTQRFVEDAHSTVRLTFSSERLDKYGRHLAFVWHGERMLNQELVAAGLARARLDYRYSRTMKRRLAAAEDQAQSASRGIWSVASASGLTD